MTSNGIDRYRIKQRLPERKLDKQLKYLFGMNVNELETWVFEEIEERLEQMNYEKEEVNMKEIILYGSYSKGKQRSSSDIDFMISYDGLEREDDLWNTFKEEEFVLYDRDGNEIEIELNFIKGDLVEHMDTLSKFRDYLSVGVLN